MLTLHRLTAGAGLARDRVDVIELLQAIAEDEDFEAQAIERSVSIDAPGEFVAEVNGELVYRALENVIRNALAPHTEMEIEARVSSEGSELVTTVSDRGPGVPLHMLEAIFEPFIRAEGSE